MKTSHFKNIFSVVYFLFCLFIAHVSASSFIRQVTDDLSTNMQQVEGVGQISKLEDGRYLQKHQEISSQKHQEISSRDYRVSGSSIVKGLRDRRPSSYLLKMESFNTLLKSTYAERYDSRPFLVGGLNWTLVVYPNGNKNDGGSGYLSLYVAIDNSTFIDAPHEEVYADLRFYVFNKKEKKYFTIQDTDVWKFNAYKTMWGFSQVLPVVTFKDSTNGYLYDGDQCEFGVDVSIPSIYKESELFSVNENIRVPTFTWNIQRFSTLLQDSYPSEAFSIGGRKWNIRVYPSGHATGEGKAMSMFLVLNDTNTIGRPYENIYVRAKLRLVNQRKLNNIERQIDHWFKAGIVRDSWGVDQVISLADLRDSSKGFIVNDIVIVQAEFEAVSSTKYYP